jgi:uncharacterized protein (DUF488 family)
MGTENSAGQVRLYTIGFTKKTAEQFFSALRIAGVKRVIDVRLNNVSQLAGFSKRDDLKYFLQELAGIDYVHLPELAPTQEMLDEYKKLKGAWSVYEKKFQRLIAERHIDRTVPPELVHGSCLLCSEPTPHHCHRRLVAEYLQANWKNVCVEHLF